MTSRREIIIKEYPELAPLAEKGVFDQCIGFYPPEGWRKLAIEVSFLLDELAHRDGIEFRVAQVKEKFGGLRYYIERGSEAMHNAIREAERISVRTCQRCGAPGHREKNNVWLSTLCDKCYADK